MPRGRLTAGFLSTRVGRRILGAFLLSSILPVLLVSVAGVLFVRQTLAEQAISRVERQVKSVSMLLLGRLSSAAEEFGRSTAPPPLDAPTPPFSQSQQRHLATGGVLLEFRGDAESPDSGVLAFTRRLPDGSLSQQLSPAEPLWSALDELIDGEAMGYCVLILGSARAIRCSPELTVEDAGIMRAAGLSGAGSEQRSQVRGLIIAHRDLFLGRELGSPSWRVVLAEPSARALAPAIAFTRTILVLLALAMVTAFALGHRQIRLSTGPLEALRDATRRVVGGDLQTPVLIASPDEYGELGSAFNLMTESLAAEFALRDRLDVVDDAALQHRRVETIVTAALAGYRSSRGCTRAALFLLDDGESARGVRWSVTREKPEPVRNAAEPTEAERRALSASPPAGVARVREATRRMSVGAPRQAPEEHGVVLPLHHDSQVIGAVTLDLVLDPGELPEQVAAAQRLADRAALGLSNVRLLERLDLISSGTLRAFARAIDANSPWTAGHSERVTQLAMAIARRLDLAERELATLYRGALMHDVGKISVPPALLDKAGPLSADERRLFERHPEVGESILSPVTLFRDALPIVRSHHERLDGTGYPDGLEGEAIPWLARILAVADTFDALVSDRPYRAGLSRSEASRIIAGAAGSQFDPRAVAAFLSLDADGTLHDLARDWPIAGALRPSPLAGPPLTASPR